jgi:transporter family protein
MNWITLAILAATSFGFYNFFMKLTADKLGPTIALMFIAGTSFIVALISTLVLKVSGQPLSLSKNVILLPILAGLFTGVAEILYLSMFAKNAPITIGTPFVVGGTVLLAVVLGLIFLKEPLNAAKTAGIVLTLIGLIILARG